MNFWESLFGWRLDSNESNYEKINHIFSVWHFVVLVLIAGGITLLCMIARKKDKPWQDKMFKVIAFIFLALEILRIGYRTLIYFCYEILLPDHGNIYNWAEIISFALCTMITFFTIATLLINKEKWNAYAYDAIFCIAMLGGLAALIYPDMLNTYYPIYHVMNVQTLITHGLLVATPILLVVTGRLQPKVNNWWKPMLQMFIFSMIARFFSKVSDSSFMFMNEGIEAIPGWENKPFLSYYWILAILFFVWVMLCYLPFVIADVIKKRKINAQPIETETKNEIECEAENTV